MEAVYGYSEESTIGSSDNRSQFGQDAYSTLVTSAESYSTLEVQGHSTLEVPGHSTLEVYNKASKLQQPPYCPPPVPEKNGDLTHNELIASIAAVAAPEGAECAATKSTLSPICGVPRKTFWIVFGLITGVFIIGAVIGGAVGGTLHRNSLSSAPTGTATGTAPGAVPVVANASNLLPSSSIASVNWVDSLGATHYRVYFQDTNNSLIQSAWDSQNQTWVASQILNATNTLVGDIKSATPMAASVRPTLGSFEIQIYILTSNDHLLYLTTSGSPDGPWTTGTFGNTTVITSAVTSLSAYWTYYQNYSNYLTVIYQDSSQALQALNFTEELMAWQGPSPLTPGVTNPVNGTGVGLIAYIPRKEFRLYADYEGQVDQVAWVPPQWGLANSNNPSQPTPANPKVITALQYNQDIQVLWTETPTGQISGSTYNISNGLWSYAPLNELTAQGTSQGGYNFITSNYDNRLYASLNSTTTGMIIQEWSFNANTMTWSKVGLVNTRP